MMSCPTSVLLHLWLLLPLTGALCSNAKRSNVDCTSISNKKELEKAVAVIGDWETLCENLGVLKSVINNLRYSNKQIGRKKSECLESYLDTDQACWEKVAMVVSEHPFYNRRLANSIANTYYGGTNQPTVQPTVQPEPTSNNVKPCVSETQSQPTTTPQQNMSQTQGKPPPENSDNRLMSLITLTMVTVLVVVVFVLFGIGIQKLWTNIAHRQSGVSEPTNMHKQTRRIVEDRGDIDEQIEEGLLPPCPVNVHVESRARSFIVKWEQPQDNDHRIVHSVQYKLESDDWPVNLQDGRWRMVEARKNEIEIPGLHPNQKYDVKVLAKYASAEDTIENWSGKEVATETRRTLFQWIQDNSLALVGLVVTVVGTIIIPLVLRNH